jgi:hypothetical protein
MSEAGVGYFDLNAQQVTLQNFTASNIGFYNIFSDPLWSTIGSQMQVSNQLYAFIKLPMYYAIDASNVLTQSSVLIESSRF